MSAKSLIIVKEPSAYAKRMKILSNKIFGEPPLPMTTKQTKVMRMMSAFPFEENKFRTTDYYPPTPMLHHLTRVLRFHGLFRDEHADFVEEQRRVRTAQGRVQKRFAPLAKKSNKSKS
uniref:Small ribosomal subunit protein mS33 n=1 Tax=Romanomermis culicivorax TaxID=13658 RepID=A0A915KUK7_ROMCU